MAYTNLKAAIDAVITANGNKEITGTILNATLKSLIDSLGANYMFKGVASSSTNPGTNDGNVFYLAFNTGTYTNFSGLSITDLGVYALVYNGSWALQTLFKFTDKRMALSKAESVSFNYVGGTWRLQMDAGAILFTNGVSVNTTTATNLAISNSNNVYILANISNGSVLVETSSTVSNQAKNTTTYVLLGMANVSRGEFTMICPYNINGSAFGALDPNSLVPSDLVTLLVKPENFNFKFDGTDWRLKIPSSSFAASYKTEGSLVNIDEMDIVLYSGINYFYFERDSTDIRVAANATTLISAVATKGYNLYLGYANPAEGIFNLLCPFSVNGDPQGIRVFKTDLEYGSDRVYFSKSLLLHPSVEVPLYKDSMFASKDSANRFNVVIESGAGDDFRRIEILNPTYLSPGTVLGDETNTRIVVESNNDKSNIVHKDLDVYKPSTNTTTQKILTIGDELWSGSGVLADSLLEKLRTRTAAYGKGLTYVGTQDVENPGSAGTTMAECKKYFGFINFVGRDNYVGDLDNPISVDLSSNDYTDDTVNPFMRIATPGDLAAKPDRCFTSSVMNPSDPDGVSYAENSSYGQYFIFDFPHYLTDHNVAEPDTVIVSLGLYDILPDGLVDLDLVESCIDIMYDSFRDLSPDLFIVFTLPHTLPPDYQDSLGAEYFSFKEKICTFIESKNDLNLRIVPLFQHTAKFSTYSSVGSTADLNVNSNLKITSISGYDPAGNSNAQEEIVRLVETALLSF